MSGAPFVPAAGSLPTREPAAGSALSADAVPQLAAGVRSHGPMQGSGSIVAPHLVRRGDGQIVQVTPLLAAVVEAIDGHRDLHQIADAAGRSFGRPLHPADVAVLIEDKLRPLGLVRSADGAEPAVRRADPLLGLRARLRVVSAERTAAIVRPFLWLFQPAVVAAVVLTFVAVSAWALLEHGMSRPIDEAMAQPTLLLALIGLIVASAAFHEVGHAAACRYGGATPGVMGAAIYLVWPAFYTDVTDSYRLDRRSRLRVDLGGLYFNAVFTVAAAAVHAATGVEALLLLVPVQLLQMVRQLVPLVRFDGYHILADLVGVPDLFSRIRPTLRRALPWHRTEDPNPLRPWAQRVIVAWVVVVVPVLLVSFALLLVNLPTLLTSSLQSLRLQSELFGSNLADGRIAATALGVVAMATVAFVPLSTLYLGGRILHRGSLKFWHATEGRPVPRAAVATAAIALLVATGPGLLPSPPTEAAGTEVAAPLLAAPGTELALAGTADTGTPADSYETASAARPTETGARRAGDRVTFRSVDRAGRAAPVPSTAPHASTPAPAPADVWPFSFPPPEPAGVGGNQVVVTNWADGTVESALSTSLEWDDDGVIDNENSAYALAACTDCRTIATAFQIVASTVPADTVVPQNLAVAANEECDRCATAAIAVQLVVTLDGTPDAAAQAQVRDLTSRIQARADAYATTPPSTIRADLGAAKAEAIRILEPWIDAVAPVEEPVTEVPQPAPGTDEPATEGRDGGDRTPAGEVVAHPVDGPEAPAEPPAEDGGAEGVEDEDPATVPETEPAANEPEDGPTDGDEEPSGDPSADSTVGQTSS